MNGHPDTCRKMSPRSSSENQMRHPWLNEGELLAFGAAAAALIEHRGLHLAARVGSLTQLGVF